MANETNNTQVEKEPLGFKERIAEAGIKQVEKNVKATVDKKLAAGETPNQTLAGLFKALGIDLEEKPQEISSQDVLKQITEIASQEVNLGGMKGPFSALGDLVQGKGYNPMAPWTGQRGTDEAIKILEYQNKLQQQEGGQQKNKLDMAKLLQDLISNTPEGRRQAELNKAEGQALAQETKEAAKTKRNYKIARGKLELTFNKFDEAIKETQRLTKGQVSGAGRVGGILTSLLGASGVNEKVKGFEGQLVEASIAIAKIAAPSSRVGPDLINLMTKTLPNIGFFSTSTKGEAIDQTATSITNAFINYVGTHEEEFPEEVDFDVFRSEVGKMLKEISDRVPKDKESQQKAPSSQDLWSKQEETRLQELQKKFSGGQ